MSIQTDSILNFTIACLQPVSNLLFAEENLYPVISDFFATKFEYLWGI